MRTPLKPALFRLQLQISRFFFRLQYEPRRQNPPGETAAHSVVARVCIHYQIDFVSVRGAAAYKMMFA